MTDDKLTLPYYYILFLSVVVMFYVKEKEAKDPRDGQDVSEVLKEKIENEEGFFEFRMLKVDPYSKSCRHFATIK